ncbi:MAG: polyphenol oxidase family protein [Actinomycetota bacterium]|nr:polyphenol oxidase family protein [Actinomycetota bacterium]
MTVNADAGPAATRGEPATGDVDRPEGVSGPVRLATGTAAWFTGRATGSIAHRHPHQPRRLARVRAAVADAIGVSVAALHFMQQVHGADVGVVDADTAPGAELRGVDALVTAEPDRALTVQVADCVPLLLGSSAGPVAAVHAGRRGVVANVVEASLEALDRLGASPRTLRAAIGPAIGGCCYEVPLALQRDVTEREPAAEATTTWGTPSLHLPGAVAATLRRSGVEIVDDWLGCTHCDPSARWFSYRADRRAGRQAGIVVRHSEAA